MSIRYDDVIIQVDKDNISALSALAAVFHMMKQDTRARTQCKYMTKFIPSTVDMDDFHNAYVLEHSMGSRFMYRMLLLAHYDFESNKTPPVRHICQEIIQQNRSCALAWEMLGYVPS